MSARQRPIYDRLFDNPSNGGPRPRHLQRMIYELTHRNGDLMPPLNYKDQHALAHHLKENYVSFDIAWAHDKAREFYKNAAREHTAKEAQKEAHTQDQKPIANLYGAQPPLEDNKSSDNQSKDDSQKAENNPQNDERYVLRTEYKQNVKHQAELFLNMEDKIEGINKRIDADNATTANNLTSLMDDVKFLKDSKPTKIEIYKEDEKTPEFTGIVHSQFPLLLKAARARLEDGTRLNLWLYGPAGTGKTHAAKSLAQALFGGRMCHMTTKMLEEFQTNYKRDWTSYNYSPTLSTSFQVMGYMDAMGKYVPTSFYFAWKYGGVFLLDEIDGSMQDALLGLNGALSSTYASFPCGVVERHKDCIILAGANTTGHGGDIEYLGTMKQNVAFLDRWAFIHWPHDDALENALVRDSYWVARVRQVRHRLQEKKIKGHVITMRASMQGAALLAAGIPFEQVEHMVLRKGIPQGQWDMIK